MSTCYGVPEVDNHWFAIYDTHHKKQLEMIKSTYNLCLFIRSEPLRLVKMQTNNTLILTDNNFANTEEEATK